MTTGRPAGAPREPDGARGARDCRRLSPVAALADMIGTVLAGPPAELADAVNDVHRLGGAAAAALLDAGDLHAWELTNRAASEITALAQAGWIPAERH